MFCIRLDSSPTYAMMCNAVAAILNIILDYIFIFELGWGIMGAALPPVWELSGGLMTLIYLPVSLVPPSMPDKVKYQKSVTDSSQHRLYD